MKKKPQIFPEYKSIEDFVEYCLEEEIAQYTHIDLNALAYSTRTSHPKVRKELEDYGLSLAYREKEKEPRGFNSNDHDRWYGKGAERTFGGSGQDQINGFSGQEG